jgi:Protein of unknown function (DUF992)
VARKLGTAVAAVALAIGALALPAPARADAGIKAGVLTCNVASGWGFIFGSTRELRCAFSRNDGSLERYVGHINKFGVDIGYQSGGVIVWAVLAPSSDVGAGALAGSYGGATGGAAVVVGGSANVLIGGFQKSFALQPVSIEGNTGLNVAAGIAQVTLRYQS